MSALWLFSWSQRWRRGWIIGYADISYIHFQKMKWPGWASSALLQMLIRQYPPVSTHSSSVPLNATLTLQSRFRLQSFPDILSQLSQASQSNLSPSQFVQFSVLLTMSEHLFIWLGSKVSQVLQVDSPSQCCCHFDAQGFVGQCDSTCADLLLLLSAGYGTSGRGKTLSSPSTSVCCCLLYVTGTTFTLPQITHR